MERYCAQHNVQLVGDVWCSECDDFAQSVILKKSSILKEVTMDDAVVDEVNLWI